MSLGHRWYLVAWDVERHDWRTFRVDRLTDPATTSSPPCPPGIRLSAVGAEFTVIAPAELRDHLRAVGELFVRSAGRDSVPS